MVTSTLPRLGVLLTAMGACVKQLPPAATPDAIAPPLADAPAPAPGQGRLVVDVTDGPAAVARVMVEAEEVRNRTGKIAYRLVEKPGELCAQTPCAEDVPLGNILLGFPVIGDPGTTEVELVNISSEPSVYRRTLSVYTDNTGWVRVLGIIMTSLGGASALTGTALLPIGLSRDNDGLATAGGITLGGGLALVTLGILAIRSDSPTYRPGASSHFPLNRPAAN